MLLGLDWFFFCRSALLSFFLHSATLNILISKSIQRPLNSLSKICDFPQKALRILLLFPNSELQVILQFIFQDFLFIFQPLANLIKILFYLNYNYERIVLFIL